MGLYESTLSIYVQAELLLEGLSIKNEDFIEEAKEIIKIYGNYKKALKAASDIDFKNGTQILYKLLDNKEDTDYEKDAKELITILHAIKSVVGDESQKYNSSEADIISRINKKASFSLSESQLYVIDELGGDNFILNITFQEPNALENRVSNIFKNLNSTSQAKLLMK